MISSKAEGLKSFIVMDIMARAQALEREGHRVIHMEVGEPDFDTPKVIQDAAIEAIRSGKTHYTHAMGLLELREAICEHYYNEYFVSISPDQVLVTTGTSPAMFLMMLALLEPNDEIIIPNPHYSCYPNFIRSAGGKVVEVQTYPGDGFIYRIEEMKNTVLKKTRGIFINSPSNPTGIVMKENHLREIAQFTDQYIISDEIYHGLVYEGKAHTILEYTDKAFVINGFSKLYAMTGWRLGYLIFPKDFSDVMERIHQSFMISANSFVQWAGIAALRESANDVNNMKKTYNERRAYMVKRLTDIGFEIHVEPTGAFYVFADARSFCQDSYKEAFNMLETIHVGVTPGIDFGSGGEGFLRFSYANSMENIKEGLDRVEKYVKGKS